MKIEQIQQIIEVAQVGSINRASQNLYIAQSTLSSSIKCVETELRQKLFIRTQKGIEQTEFGKIFVKYGKTILEAYQHIQSASNLQYRNGSNSAFKISIYYLLFANRLLYQMFNKYSDQNINFHYINTPRDRILFDVAHNISEIGIIAMHSHEIAVARFNLFLWSRVSYFIYRTNTYFIWSCLSFISVKQNIRNNK